MITSTSSAYPASDKHLAVAPFGGGVADKLPVANVAAYHLSKYDGILILDWKAFTLFLTCRCHQHHQRLGVMISQLSSLEAIPHLPHSANHEVCVQHKAEVICTWSEAGMDKRMPRLQGFPKIFRRV